MWSTSTRAAGCSPFQGARLPEILVAALAIHMPRAILADQENGVPATQSALSLSITALSQGKLRVDLSREANGNAVLQSSPNLRDWSPEKLLPLHSTSVQVNISASEPNRYFRVVEGIPTPTAKSFGQSYSCNAEGTICGGNVGVTLESESFKPYPQGSFEVTVISNTGIQQNGHVVWGALSYNWSIPGRWDEGVTWSPVISRRVQ